MVQMLRFIGSRLVSAVGVLLVLLAALYVLQTFTPVNPVRVLLGPQASEAARAEAEARLGLDRPIWEQYLAYVGRAIRGDFGISTRTNTPVADELVRLAPATLELIVFAGVLVVLGSVLLAYVSAARWRGADALRGVMTAFASAPGFLLGLLVILLLSHRLGLVPGSGRTSFHGEVEGPTGWITIDAIVAARPDIWWDGVQHLFFPALCIAIGPAVAVGRVLRGNLLDSFTVPYARTAFAKGLSRRQVILRHSARNSLNSTLSILGLQFGVLVAGAIIIEQVFSWPGLGFYLSQAIPANDFPVISSITLLLGSIYIVVNIVVDLLQAIADPRILR